jgi:hypothetical protein
MKPLAFLTLTAGYLLQSQQSFLGPADVVVGHLKGMVENYVKHYDDHKTECANQDESMQKLSDAAVDMESKQSIITEKQKLQAECDKTLTKSASMVKALDDVMGLLKPHQNWMEKHPELETKVKDIYGAHPAVTMMQKRTHLSRKYLRNLITEAEKGLLE